ncbi:MAG: hypothetical protein ACLGGX_10220 [Bdellovibrionia bacterium]
MAKLKRLEIEKVPTFLTRAVFCLFIAASSSSLASTYSLQCSSIFLPKSDLFIPMNPSYRGEDLGLYRDTISNKQWNVIYFTPRERGPFTLRLQAGLLRDHRGQLFSTPFNSDNGQFESVLFVINKKMELLYLPFEQRGKYHHSTLSAGDDIIFAGTMIVVDGRMTEVSNHSGHYKPSTEQTVKVLRLLHEMGLDHSRLNLVGISARELGGAYSLPVSKILE